LKSKILSSFPFGSSSRCHNALVSGGHVVGALFLNLHYKADLFFPLQSIQDLTENEFLQIKKPLQDTILEPWRNESLS